MKKLFALLLSCAMLLSFSVTAFAAESTTNNVSEEIMDATLLDRGYPNVILEKMSPTAKESLYEKPELVFDGGVITIYDESTGTFIDYDISANGYMPMGQIPTTDLSLTWSISKNRNNSDEIFVTYSYDWDDLPFFRWQDPIAVSWDDSLFEMKDDSFYKVDKYDGYYINSSGVPTGKTFTGAIKSEEYGYASGFAAGVTWYADLRGYDIIYVADALYGHGEFTLEKKTSGTGSSKMYGHYVHPTASASVSLSVPKFGSFSVSGGSSYDERGNQKTFSYTLFLTVTIENNSKIK